MIFGITIEQDNKPPIHLAVAATTMANALEQVKPLMFEGARVQVMDISYTLNKHFNNVAVLREEKWIRP